MKQFIIVLGILCLSLWHAWQWLFHRLFSSPGEAIGLTVVLSVILLKCAYSLKHNTQIKPVSALPLSVLLLIYAASFYFPVPNIMRAALAVLIVSIYLHQSVINIKVPAPLIILLLLSLPIVPSLQFYLGYPARIAAASLTVPLLQLNGLNVVQEGSNLLWHDLVLQFDAPCSGVKMLWTGTWLSMFLAWIYSFNFRNTALLLCTSCALVLIGNVLRACSLFYLETGLLPVDESGLHEATGSGAFIITVIAIVYFSHRVQLWSVSR